MIALRYRGSGLLDDLPADAGAQAAARAYERLSERDQCLIDCAVEMVVAGVQQRRGSAQFGRTGALELLAALGRLI